jgi:hypothetical protein
MSDNDYQAWQAELDRLRAEQTIQALACTQLLLQDAMSAAKVAAQRAEEYGRQIDAHRDSWETLRTQPK